MYQSEETGGSLLDSLAHSTSEHVTATSITTPDAGVVTNAETNGDSSSPGGATTNHREVTRGAPPVEQRRRNNQTVQHKLTGTQLFMITINGTLGTGLYMRSGQIIQLGGPVAVVVSFTVLGILVWAVMQSMTELLCLWPIPGALPLFIRKFVDEELGIAVGVTYWFTYSVGFAALIASAASILNYWTHDIPGITLGIIYIALPCILIGINKLEIGLYGLFEAITGAIKLTFLIIILIFLILNWKDSPEYDSQAASEYAGALFMCFSIAIFAYTGVEIIAASAIEAKWQTSSTTSQQTQEAYATGMPLTTNTIKFTAGKVPIFVALVYTLSGVIVSLGLHQGHKDLYKLSWIKYEDRGTPMSPFIIVAKASKIPGLDHVFNAFILFTALTCANTNLYVASRTLYGMAKNVHDKNIFLNFFASFKQTDDHFVPFRAVVVSAVLFIWLPFLQIPDDFGDSFSLAAVVEILAQMGSISIVIVWACQCLTFIRFYICIEEHRAELDASGIGLWGDRTGKSPDYPYRSHWQPWMAVIAFVGCLFILLVCNGAFLWVGFSAFPFLSSYLIHIIFLALWLILKAFKGFHSGLTFFVKLDKDNTIKAIRALNVARQQSTETEEQRKQREEREE
ncbi:hypothetical protein FOMG_18250 [Fusarium oxysporum f. sp. melonis 26406]|uniref:Amino acid permease/ SLC12A domain-containing protein n=1 Tax=Fusarium oxysporum f. sp. melonis 26406 TaxID=1089452 RepID=W9Z903_FUSOX|nr:hypothetical protein FOMG_18250 [Fusarium oxysporum f. sp. melonis 26406]